MGLDVSYLNYTRNEKPSPSGGGGDSSMLAMQARPSMVLSFCTGSAGMQEVLSITTAIFDMFSP
jgi:hypothetical protein